jgi:hypothetical protein
VIRNAAATTDVMAAGSQPARSGRSRAARVLALCLAVPAAVLAGSYIWLTIDHGTPLLWNVIVHEGGRYTLGETILYFSHFLREVPVAIAYALFLLGISGNAGSAADRTGRPGRMTMRLAILAAAGLITIAFGVTVSADGAGSALRDLLQYRTRDDLAGYGTHWRYHLLSTLWFGAVTMIAPPLIRSLTGGTVLGYNRRMVRAAWLYFALLTLVFGLSPDVLQDIRYVGHQAREIMTHGPVTLLLGIGLLLAAGLRSPQRARYEAMPGRSAIAGQAALVLLIPVFLAIVSVGGNVMEHGQADAGLGAIVAAHYFEHTLDYTLVLLLVTAGLALHRQPARRSLVANGSSTGGPEFSR